MSSRRISVISLVLTALALAGPLTAQIQLGGISLSASGSINAGYAGDLSGNSGGSSDHSVGLGGQGSVNGYYYSPSFISFQATPYYGRSQASAGTGSIGDSSGYTSNIGIFGGSHSPGNISFNQSFDSTGQYGIPGTGIGLTTQDSNRSFGIGWSIVFPELPSLSVGYSTSSGTSSVLGSNAEGHGTNQVFTVHSGYFLDGFRLSGGYTHTSSQTDETGFLANTSGSSGGDTFSFITGHAIPRGSFNLSLTRSSYDSTSAAGTDSGTNDTINASVGTRIWVLPLTVGVGYNDNVYGSVEEEILASGGTFQLSSSSPATRSLTVSASSSFTLLRKVFVTCYADHQEEYVGGQSFGITQYGANGAYNFGKRFKGLTITIGALDTANAAGNSGASMLANVNYRHYLGPWEVDANFGYQQQVQTLLALYTTSSLNYGASVTRKLSHDFRMSAGAGGGRSGFNQMAGNLSQAESLNGSFGWRNYGLGGTYSRSSGQSVLTSSGLVTLPAPIVSANDIVVFDGKAISFAASAAPLRNLSINVSYSKSNSTAMGGQLNTINQTTLYNGYLTYRFRKVFFNSGVTKFQQGVGGQGVPASMITSYYFGISRWFNFF